MTDLGALGPVPVVGGTEIPSRMAVFLWGPATCGKSTFAATAPGDKLWLSFGDNEHASVSNRPDVRVADVSQLSHSELFKHAKSENPFGLDSYLTEHESVETVVVDSATAIEYKALQKAVADGIGAGRGFTPTMEAPGISAYGGRNAILIETLTGLLRVTAKHNVHIIITAHEGDPVMTKAAQGQQEMIDYYTIMLGGKLVNNMTWRLSEIWHMWQETMGEKDRRIAVRPTRKRRPMKSRMFRMSDEPDFSVTYDSEKPDGDQLTIAKLFYQWMDGGKVRIPVPKTPVKGTKK